MRTVYNFGESSMRWSDTLFILPFTVIGAITIARALKARREGHDVKQEMFVGLFLLLGTLYLIYTVLNYADYKKTKDLLAKGNYKTIQDTVRNYNKVYRKGNWIISFDLGSIHFVLNDGNAMNYGCTGSDIKDRRIGNGVFLYVDYITAESGNEILRIKRD